MFFLFCLCDEMSRDDENESQSSKWFSANGLIAISSVLLRDFLSNSVNFCVSSHIHFTKDFTIESSDSYATLFFFSFLFLHISPRLSFVLDDTG